MLRAWAESNSDRKLSVFTLIDGRVVVARLAPRSTAYEDDMLTLTRDVVAGMDKHAIEQGILQIVDNEAHLERYDSRLDIPRF